MAKKKIKKQKEAKKPQTSEKQKPRNPENEIIKVKRTKIRVIGIGGGGSSIVSSIASRIKKASFVAANTDAKALREAGRNVIRFQFGENLTHGLGTGMNPEIGKMAALAEKDKIKKLFDGQDLCVIVACLGGGTASGAAPIFAKIAKGAGCLTYGIFTLPFAFEGEKKAAIARESLREVKQKLHALSVIPNEKIFQVVKKETPLRQALSAINEKLVSDLEGLIEIIYEPGLINIDYADLKTVLEGQGRIAYLNTVQVQRKEGAVQEAAEKLLDSPLHSYNIRGAKGVLYNIASEKGLTLEEVNQISKAISDLVNKEAKIIFGILQNQKYAGLVKITLLATGCAAKDLSEGNKEGVGKVLKPKGSEKRKAPETSKKETPEKKKKTEISTRKEKISKKKQNTAKRGGKKKIAPQKIKKIKIKKKSPEKKKTENFPQGFKREFLPGPEINASQEKSEPKIRKNALQVKKEADEEEAEILEREKVWETPAFLRRKKII